jgi:hypothetical protein
MIIYNSVSEEIQRKFTQKEDGLTFVNDLLLLYGPNDKNKDGQNLLTIFLNNSDNKNYIDSDTLNNFFSKKFKLQVDKIVSTKWNALINHFISNNRLKDLPKFLTEKDDWFYFKIPTFYIKELVDCFYNPKVSLYNEKETVLNYFFNSSILFETPKEVITYLNNVVDVLTNLFVKKDLPQEKLEYLVSREFLAQLYCCIEQRLDDFQNVKRIEHVLSSVFNRHIPQIKQTHGFDSETYLLTLKSEIFSKILDNDLNKKSIPIKKPTKI